MLLNVKEVLQKDVPVSLQGRLDMTPLLGSRQDLAGFSAADAKLEAVPGTDMVVVHGSVKLDVEQRCSRCLEPVHDRLTIPFQESFTQSKEAASLDEDLVLVSEDKVDLDPYVEEAVLIGIPYIPLCSNDCKGLCPVCGTNRNTDPCSCKQEKIDPRLAGLADFFKE
ncbi:DUF177 domain-containing protein [Paenibacillus chartarius]|uniref:DUF177 domain-containing protein n=1 Tax=Paenibacillus chartarius TaxID=747481 RepID=A0ABV6DNT9_9BACL